MSELDLDPSELPGGDERPELPSRGGGSGRSASKPTTSDGGKGTKSATAARAEANLEADLSRRIEDSIVRIADALSGRGETELSSALHEDAHKMASSIVNMTRKVKFLRGPLVFLLAIVEPVLAWGRVTVIGFRKLFGWRNRETEDGDSGEG